MSNETKTNETSKPGGEGLSRRGALRGLGLVGAGAIVGGAAGVATHAAAAPGVDPTARALHKPYVRGAEHFGTHEERWLASSCGCSAACGIRVRVVEGRAVRIEGNAAHPASRGGASARALSTLQSLYDPDRIAGPLFRRDGRLVPMAWEPAIALLADRLAGLRRRGAPEELVVMTGRQPGATRELLGRFCQGFGTPNVIDTRPAPFSDAMGAATGIREEPVFDWSRANYVLMLEAGIFEDSCRSAYVSRVLAEIRFERTGSHASVVHAGPAFDLSAHNADRWIKTTPGSSGALALGICHVLLREGLHDTKLAADRSSGFDGFRRWVGESFSPERAAVLAGITPKIIVDLARELAARKPSFAFADEKTLSFTNARETAGAVLALNALLGSLGSVVGLEGAAPFAKWPEIEADVLASAGLARPRIAATPDAFVGRRPGVVLLDQVNPLHTRSQPASWRRALASAPFVVSFSSLVDESVEAAAHLVLPDHTVLERWDDASSFVGLGNPVASVRRPVIEPLLDTRATGDVLLDVARRLGDPVARALPWRSFREALDVRLRGLFEAKRGSIVAPNASAFLARLFEAGFWHDPLAPRRPLDSFVFPTAYADPTWAGDEHAFPLRLLAYEPLGDPSGSGGNQPWLRVLRSRPRAPFATTYASVHPDSAPKLENGDPIAVESPFGAIVAAVHVDARMPVGYVAVPTGGGHEAFGRWAKGRGANVFELLPPQGAALGATRVRIARRPR